MTDAETISVKIPAKILEEIPAAGNGRSSFILTAIEEKIARRKPLRWKPTTKRGRRLATLLEKGRDERMPLLSDSEMEVELTSRRGRNF
jgi:hypothetical protein